MLRKLFAALGKITLLLFLGIAYSIYVSSFWGDLEFLNAKARLEIAAGAVVTVILFFWWEWSFKQ